eukprot:5442146-Pleurochrysis_carterae.AAC.2
MVPTRDLGCGKNCARMRSAGRGPARGLPAGKAPTQQPEMRDVSARTSRVRECTRAKGKGLHRGARERGGGS